MANVKVLSKKKALMAKAFGIGLVVLMAFSALFSTDGMGLTIGGTFVTGMADILSNFVTVLNFLVVVVAAAIILVYFMGDEKDFNKTIDSMVEKLGVLETGNRLAFKKVQFFTITVPFWCVLIASGWITTVLVWALLSAVMNLQLAAQREYFKKTYLNEVEGKKDEDTGSNTDDLSRNSLL